MQYSRQQLIDHVAQRLHTADLYYGHGTENAYDEAAWLVIQVLGFSPAEPMPDPDALVNRKQQQAVEEVVGQRIATRKPLAYLLNSAWFYGLEFYVDERVLVPRSPIAELIGHGFSPWLAKPPRHILDLCTGSGCIAIACAGRFPQANIDATDIDLGALAVADINCRKHRVEKQVTLHRADVFEGLPLRQYDVIVSNPPYVDADGMAGMPEEYRREPALALAAGSDGLSIVRRILQQASDYLAGDGVLICEVGDSEEALMNAFPSVPFVWLEFEYGGHGVFLLTAQDLRQYKDLFQAV